jgi:uncharacterized protein
VSTIVPADVDALLALNNANAVETSLLDRAKLARMISAAFFARTIDGNQALLLAFDQSSDYEGVNFRWFRERYPRFIYVDRIIVAETARGRGIARGLYADLFIEARVHGQHLIAAEVNRTPPNPASDAFHERLGFVDVGRGSPSPGKVVRYLTKSMLDA